MDLIIYFLVFLTTLLILISIYEMLFTNKTKLKQRMNQIMDESEEPNDEYKKPFIQRVIKPGYLSLMKLVGNITPKSIKDKYEKLIKTSGYTQKITVNNLLLIQIMLAMVQGGSCYILIRYSRSEMDYRRVVLSSVLGFLLPLLYVYTKSEKRKDNINRSLPDLLDLVYVSVEAGLGFDASLKKSCEKKKGILSNEFLRCLNEIAKGKDRAEAFRDVTNRTGVEDVAAFVRAIIQTERLGSNITNMLRIQSVTMRQRRRQRAEEKAAKVPVKMLFPIMFFMFPSLFVVILGPAAIRIYQNFITM